jgi:hypothetical protein
MAAGNADRFDFAMTRRRQGKPPGRILSCGRSARRSASRAAIPFAAPAAPAPAAPAAAALSVPRLRRPADAVPLCRPRRARRQSQLLLARENDVLPVQEGDTLEGGYRVESIGAEDITLLYLPLGVRQRLSASAGALGSRLAQVRWQGPSG